MSDEDIELPPLPKASKMYDIPGYDEEELKDYARTAILADRERRAQPATEGEEIMVDTEQERAEFEAWAEQRGMELHKVSPCDGSEPYYLDGAGRAAWKAWQARAALQSQDREDALRYRFIRSIVSASNARGRGSWQFHYDRLPMPLNNPMKGSVAQHFDEAIDHARRIEGEL